MQQRLMPILLAILAMAVACQKEKQDDEIPEPMKPTEPKPLAKVAKAAISSVQILQDCPDAKPANPKAEQTPAKSALEPAAIRAPAESRPASRRAPSDRKVAGPGLYASPCQQSTIQIDFSGQGPESAAVVLKELRLLSAEGKPLATLSARGPGMWQESEYTTWDEVLPADSDLKASYKITPPNWGEVESELGSPSHGRMFVLEAKIDVGGQEQVVRSSEFARFRPEMVPT